MYERITNGLAGTRKEEKEKEKGERLGCWDTYEMFEATRLEISVTLGGNLKLVKTISS